MSDKAELLLDGAQRSHVPAEQSQAPAQSSGIELKDVTESILPDGNAGGAEVAVPVGARQNTAMPPDYTDAEATELWQGAHMTWLMLACFVLASAKFSLALLYGDSMPLVCIMLFTSTLPTIGATCAYFFVRARGLEPTWSLVKKVSMAAGFAFFTAISTDVNLGVYALTCIFTGARSIYEYPDRCYIIFCCVLAACHASSMLMVSIVKLVQTLALSHHRAART